MSRILDAPDALARLLGRHGGWLFMIAVVITTFEVFMRYGFNEPQSWVHDLSIALCATGFFIAGPLAQERDAHIRLGAVQEFAPPAVARVCALLANLFTLLFLVGLLIAAVRQAERSIAVVETTGRAWDVPIPMVLKTLLVLAVLLLLLQIVAAVVKGALTLMQGRTR